MFVIDPVDTIIHAILNDTSDAQLILSLMPPQMTPLLSIPQEVLLE